MVLIQHGLFASTDDCVLCQVGQRLYKVPVWLWFHQHHPGGLYELIQTWQHGILTKIHTPEPEARAIRNIEDDSYALLRFYANPYQQTYYNNLGKIELQALRMERKVMAERPHLKGKHFYEEIAGQLNRCNGYGFTALRVKAILRDATDMLRIVEERRRIAKYKTFARAIYAGEAAAEIDQSQVA